MRASRIAVAPARAAKTYALDLEFVKHNRSVYARSAVFVPFRRHPTPSNVVTDVDATNTGATKRNLDASSLPQLTELLERPVVLELRPQVVMQLASALPCGHLLREMINERFAPTPALNAVLQSFAAESADALKSFQDLQRTLRVEQKEAAKQAAKETCSAAPSTNDFADRLPSTTEEDEGDEAGGSSSSSSSVDEATTNTTHVAARAPQSASPSASAETLVRRALQMRYGIAHNFRGLDPYSIPNVSRFNKEALELLHAAPVDSRDFCKAAKQLATLLRLERGKGGYKSLASCVRNYPAFIQRVLRTVFESPTAWSAWLSECSARAEADLQRVRDAHCAGTYARPFSPRGSSESVGVDFCECDSLEELATRMSAVWGHLVRRDAATTREGEDEEPFFSKLPTAKIFVYGTGDAAVIRSTLELQRYVASTTPRVPTAVAADGAPGRFLRKSTTTPASTISASLDVDSERSISSTPVSSSAATMSPYEARAIDVTAHSLFVASGFSTSVKKTPNLSVALEKAAGRDATAAAVLALHHPHDPLWDAQALACICTSAGIVR